MPAHRNRSKRTRRSRGGANHMGASLSEAFADAVKPVAQPAMPAAMPPMKGGKKKTRKMSKGASDWTKSVTKIYRQMKAKDKSVKLGDAMKRASALKKRGQL